MMDALLQTMATNASEVSKTDDDHPKVAASHWGRGFLFLILTLLVLFFIFRFLQWRRKRIQLSDPPSYSVGGGGGFFGLFQPPPVRRFNWDQGYDPLSQQQFLFEEELDVELGDYNFEGQVPSTLRETKLRTSELRNSLADDGRFPASTGLVQANSSQAPFNVESRTPKLIDDEDDADVLKWAERNLN
ncbi:hypothetical protein BC829DRAFT_31867 [Chytridium lagenaria]|nr:hypothetical protein BC829DRAFT_31867 [Chytridium lagenaria]